MTLAERAVARVLAGAVGAVTAGVAGAAVAFASGLIGPLGSQARFEPTPGFRPPWAVALGGGAVLALLFMAMTAGAAAVVARPRRAVPRSRRAATPRSAAGLRCWRGSGWRGAVPGPRVASGPRRPWSGSGWPWWRS